MLTIEHHIKNETVKQTLQNNTTSSDNNIHVHQNAPFTKIFKKPTRMHGAPRKCVPGLAVALDGPDLRT